MTKTLFCSLPVATLLAAAQRLVDHDELPAALTLIHAVLAEHPGLPAARALLTNSKPADSPQADDSPYYVDMDYHTGMFAVLNADDEHIALFESRAEADQYLKGLT
jgi:hypothetical protein